MNVTVQEDSSNGCCFRRKFFVYKRHFQGRSLDRMFYIFYFLKRSLDCKFYIVRFPDNTRDRKFYKHHFLKNTRCRKRCTFYRCFGLSTGWLFKNSGDCSVGILCWKADLRTQKVVLCSTHNPSSNTAKNRWNLKNNTKKYSDLEWFLVILGRKKEFLSIFFTGKDHFSVF